MRKILVPIDFSENTENSVQTACDIARRLNCGIILFNSYYELLVLQSISGISNMEMIPVVDPEISITLHAQAEREIHRVQHKIEKRFPEVPIQYIISAMNLKEKVIDICEQEDVLMIVMSATGSGKKDSFSGSAASTLFDCAPVPIVAIPENYLYEELTGLKNILYATDFSDAAEVEIEFILKYFQNENHRIICCHLRFDDINTQKENNRLEYLSKKFETERMAGKISFELIKTSNVEEALEFLTEENDIGLISFHEHNRSFFYRFFHRSVIKKNIFRFNIPLLVFRQE